MVMHYAFDGLTSSSLTT